MLAQCAGCGCQANDYSNAWPVTIGKWTVPKNIGKRCLLGKKNFPNIMMTPVFIIMQFLCVELKRDPYYNLIFAFISGRARFLFKVKLWEAVSVWLFMYIPWQPSSWWYCLRQRTGKNFWKLFKLFFLSNCIELLLQRNKKLMLNEIDNNTYLVKMFIVLIVYFSFSNTACMGSV